MAAGANVNDEICDQCGSYTYYCSSYKFPFTVRMPQQPGGPPPAGIEEEDIPHPPLPVVTHVYSIPPHLMGRNIENPVEDIVGPGRRLQKPRLGVKVPYRNLTSQIVTQEEIAQELIERSIKKYPVHGTPEGGDLFFAIKLTQRLAKRLSPSASASPGDVELRKVPLYQSSASTNCSVASTSVVTQQTYTDQELLAILEGDDDTTWLTNKVNTACVTTSNSVAIDNPPIKMDPDLEKEIALKQLMEFQTKKDKADKASVKSAKRPRQRVKREEQIIDTKYDTKEDERKIQNIQNKSAKDTHSEKKTHKRTNGEPIQLAPKKQRFSKKLVNGSNKPVKKSEGKTVNKPARQSKKKLKETPVNGVGIHKNNVKPASETQVKLKSPRTIYKSRKDKLSPMSVQQNLIINTSASKICEFVKTTSVNDLHEIQNSFLGRSHSDINESTVISNTILSGQKCTPRSSIVTRNVNVPKMDNSVTVLSNDVTCHKDEKHTKRKISAQLTKKGKGRLSEVDRLLMDEGAINILYELEQNESRKRSGFLSEKHSVPIKTKRNIKSTAMSIHRKRKNLLLKARTVKKAVLMLANSPEKDSMSRRLKKHMLPSITIEKSKETANSSSHIKHCIEVNDSTLSPSVLSSASETHTQQFSYPQKHQLPAEASRIIRRHSSSSTFSSRSGSPNMQQCFMVDMRQSVQNNPSNLSSTSKAAFAGEVKPTVPVKQKLEVRKKGVPIFVRKVESSQTYKGKRKLVKIINVISSNSQTGKSNSDKLKEMKVVSKTQVPSAQKNPNENKKKSQGTSVLKIDTADKSKLSTAKTMSKSLQKTNSTKLKKFDAKIKKKDDVWKDKVTEHETINQGEPLDSDKREHLTLLGVERKISRKPSVSSVNSHSSSHCHSRSSKSPTPAQSVTHRKEIRIAAPLSPNAATYSNLLKTLENDSQKLKRKDGEESLRQRSSGRQNAGTYHYKEICLRRYENLVQVILTPASTKMKNSFNLQVLRELRDALHQLRRDDSCRVVLLTSTGPSFCQGIDVSSLMHTNIERRKHAASELALGLRDFLKCLALFNKPIVAGVQGMAIGLGVTMLPFFDMVFASDKATFYTPYAKLGQVPEGAAILTLPHMFGNALTSELLFGCRKLTAREALHFGLVTRILWPDRFLEELIPVIRNMSNQSAQSMDATKALLRHGLRTKLDAALNSETHLLVQHWVSVECQTSFRRFLDDEEIGLQRPKIDP